MDQNGDLVFEENLFRLGFVKRQSAAVLTNRYFACGGAVGNVNFVYVAHVGAAVADGAEDPAAVGVRAEHRRLDEGGADDALGDHLCRLFVGSAVYLADQELGRALAVGGKLLGDRLERRGEHLQKGVIILVFLGNLGVAGVAGGEDGEGVVGGGVAVHAHHVVAHVSRRKQRFVQHVGGDRRVGRDKGERGAHVDMDHAAALGDAADGHGLAADHGLHRPFLFDGVGGHDRLRRVGAAVLGEDVLQLPDAAFDRRERQRLTDNACGGDDHVVLVNAERLCRKACHLLRLFVAVGVAGVRVAGVDDHRLRPAVLQMLLGDIDRIAFDKVLGEDRGGIAHLVACNQRQIAFSVGDHGGFVCLCCFGDGFGGRLLDACANAVCRKACRRRYAAVYICIVHSFSPCFQSG